MDGDEMTNKFTVGSQWMTKGGWRAVVVDTHDTYLTICHTGPSKIIYHHLNGGSIGPGGYSLDGYCIDKPYTEPRKGTVWVGVWLTGEDDVFAIVYYTAAGLNADPRSLSPRHKLIASFKHDWTENEKL